MALAKQKGRTSGGQAGSVPQAPQAPQVLAAASSSSASPNAAGACLPLKLVITRTEELRNWDSSFWDVVQLASAVQALQSPSPISPGTPRSASLDAERGSAWTPASAICCHQHMHATPPHRWRRPQAPAERERAPSSPRPRQAMVTQKAREPVLAAKMGNPPKGVGD